MSTTCRTDVHERSKVGEILFYQKWNGVKQNPFGFKINVHLLYNLSKSMCISLAALLACVILNWTDDDEDDDDDGHVLLFLHTHIHTHRYMAHKFILYL